jgi:hypothetical protein
MRLNILNGRRDSKTPAAALAQAGMSGRHSPIMTRASPLEWAKLDIEAAAGKSARN